MNLRAWIREVVPLSILAFAAGLYLLSISCSLVFQQFVVREPLEFPLVDETGPVLLTALSFFYGFYRGGFFHPVFRKDYRDWLHRTPWKSGLPLPVGPPHVVWQDVLLLGSFVAVTLLHKQPFLLAIPATFLGAYLVVQVAALSMARHYVQVLILAYGFGGLLYLHGHPELSLLLLIGMYGIGWHGLHKSLKSFHIWELEYVDNQIVCAVGAGNTLQDVARSKLLGWPFDRMAPRTSPVSIPMGWAIGISCLFGWWLGGMLTQVPSFERFEAAMLAFAFLQFVALTRLVIYVWGYAPPLSLWGRIRTLRLIIPGYDVVFIAPLMMFLIPAVPFWMIPDRNVAAMTVPFCTSLQILIALKFPPSLDKWRLTGTHRIIPANSLQIGELQQTQ